MGAVVLVYTGLDETTTTETGKRIVRTKEENIGNGSEMRETK